MAGLAAAPVAGNAAGGTRRSWIDRLGFVLWAGGAAFCVYFSMYAFRKPFTAVSYADVGDWHFAVDFKITLIIAQVAGYAMSKFIGVKFIAEIGAARRSAAIIALIGLAWLALVLFAVVPTPLKPLALFLNGLPLGLIWGLVFSYLEGRRSSDMLGAMLCASFIVSSGVTKSAGVWLINDFFITEYWMPAMTGLLFMPLLGLSLWALSRLPPPDAEDIAERTARVPMNAGERRAVLRAYGPGIAALVLSYVVFTIIRDFRDNFAAEIWQELGFGGVSSVFSASEAPIGLITLLVLGGLVVVRDNRRALAFINAIILFGAGLILAATAAFQMGILSPLAWMLLSGLGLYLAYTPFNAMLFDRLIAATGTVGTAGFLIYVADAAGYLGSVVLLLVRNFLSLGIAWLEFYILLSCSGAVLAMLLVGASGRWFAVRLRNAEQAP